MSNDTARLVSVIVPVYNAEQFLSETIATVQAQTYKNWELIFVDDKSTDKSVNIINAAAKRDARIRLIKNKVNSGAAHSRNAGIDAAGGRYLAFLDADDLWVSTKLKMQIAFMQEKDCAFSFTGYEFADATGKPNGKKVYVPATLTYKQALKNTTIWTSTVMFDMTKLSKEDIHMPNVPSEDSATWWRLHRTKVPIAYSIPSVLSYYRRQDGTLSANKFTALKRTWNLYRNVECFNKIISTYYFSWYVFNAIRRRV